MPTEPTETHAERTAREALARVAVTDRTAELARIIRPLRTAQYEVDHEWFYFQRALDGFVRDYGSLELDPDFQRGHVWTPEQQQLFLENVLRGVVSSSGFLVQFNCPNWDTDEFVGDLPAGVQCIDGLQRITAVQDFLAGKVQPFGLTVDDLAGSSFSVRGRYRFRVAIHTFTWRADLLQHYLDLNTGGTPHSPEEIERVRVLRDSALEQRGSL